MDQAKQWTFELERFVVFLREVLDPAVYPVSAPIAAAVWQSPERPPFAQARAASFAPVSIGFTWGPRWSTAWFKVSGQIPTSMAGRHVVLRFSTDTEALAWSSAGAPIQGFDANRDALTLAASAKGGEAVELYVEAACNHAFGDRGLQWDPPEIHRRWNSDKPGLFERCELAVLDPVAWQLRHAYAFVLDLAKNLPPDSARARQLLAALRTTTNLVPDRRVNEFAQRGLDVLTRVISGPSARAGGSATICHAVGHAHIDTAWLWPLGETRRKLHRTFANVLGLMERHPQFNFMCSQAWHYDSVERTCPALFDKVRARVNEGRWEPTGAMWVEPDATAPSGESLVRQMLIADRYWRSRFGDRAKQRLLYLPDTFGFPAQLPQLMRLAGLDTFVTNKLHWNSHTNFPFTTFQWRGLDGSTVLAHNTPGMDYNACNTPKELIRGEKTHKAKDLAPPLTPRWLQPFGFGDGGGGPTDWSIQYALWARDCEGLPRVKLSTSNEFCEALHADAGAIAESDPSALPTHSGELYLELHRGTYTTHGRLKQANQESEELLRTAEILAFAGPKPLEREESDRVQMALDEAWKLVLLNQFHDILPGSSITEVYDDAKRDHERVRALVQPVIDEHLQRWVDGVSPLPGESAQAPVVFNPAFFAGGSLNNVALVVGDRESRPEHVHAEILPTGGALLQSGGFKVEIDALGRITFIAERTGQRLTPESPLNDLVLYEDRPRLWDAWDIDAEYAHKGEPVRTPATITIVDRGPGTAAVRVERALGESSRIKQTYIVRDHSRTVEIETHVHWHEERRLLRALFPTGLSAPFAEFGTQMGIVRRPTHANTPAQQAAFEVPVHGFVRLSLAPSPSPGPARSFSVLTGPKFGASCQGSVIGLSLLRSTKYPDPTADRGEHRFTYGLALSDPIVESERLLRPPLVTKRAVQQTPAPAGERSSHPWTWWPIEVASVAPGLSPRVECLKRSHDDPHVLVLRVCDYAGATGRLKLQWSFPVMNIRVADLLERPLDDGTRISHDDSTRTTTLEFTRPFQIITLLATRADA